MAVVVKTTVLSAIRDDSLVIVDLRDERVVTRHTSWKSESRSSPPRGNGRSEYLEGAEIPTAGATKSVMRLRLGCIGLPRAAAFCNPKIDNCYYFELFRAFGTTLNLRVLGSIPRRLTTFSQQNTDSAPGWRDSPGVDTLTDTLSGQNRVHLGCGVFLRCGQDVRVVFRVRLICECPSVCIIVLASTPRASINVAHECRRSWSRISGSFAAVNSALNWRVTLRGSSGVPTELVNTNPRSFHFPPAASRASSWVTHPAV